MSKLINLTGKKFGRLTVINRSYPNERYEHAMWLCKCNCGVEKIIRGDSLSRGESKSCGCLRDDLNRLELGLASMRRMIISYKKDAKKRGLEYELTEEQFKKITSQDCHYCGAKPNNISKSGRHFGDYIYNGIDRVDNNKGYTMDNVVPCCKVCNIAKHQMTLQDFKDWVSRIYNKMFREDD